MIKGLLKKLLSENKTGIVLGSVLVTGELRDDGTMINYDTNMVNLHKGYEVMGFDLNGNPKLMVPVKSSLISGTYDYIVETECGDVQVLRRSGLPLEVGSSIRL